MPYTYKARYITDKGLYEAPKNSTITPVQSVVFNTISTNKIQTTAGEFMVEAVSGGGRGWRTDGGSDQYGDTAWAYHYYSTGGTGAYFRGKIYLQEGEHIITVGAQSTDMGSSGGSISIDDEFVLSGGMNGFVAGSTWGITRKGGELITDGSVVLVEEYNIGNSGNLAGGYKDNNTASISSINAPVPASLISYGVGGGVSSGTVLNGTSGYVKITPTSGIIYTDEATYKAKIR